MLFEMGTFPFLGNVPHKMQTVCAIRGKIAEAI
jgi:hypothetical protein